MTSKLYQSIAGSISALHSCEKSPVNEFGVRIHSEALDQFEQLLPSGSGIDCGTKIDRDRSNGNKIILTFSFHHMNENGMYEGWTEHELTVTPSLQFGFEMRISGRDRNQIKEYLYDVYRYALDGAIDSEVNGEGADREIKFYSVSMRESAKRYQESISAQPIR